MYDLANQFFAMNVISLYFPRWLTIVKGMPEIGYSITFGISMFFVSIAAPIWGTVSDLHANKRQLLVFSTLVSVIFTVLIGISSNVFLALIFFAVANFGCQIAGVFYNALMVHVTPPNKTGVVSGVGRMFAYLGALLAISLTKPVMAKWGYEATFVITGVYFLLFSLPVMIFVDEPKSKTIPLSQCFSFQLAQKIFGAIKNSFKESKAMRDFRILLKFIFWGSCAINTMILFMSVLVGQLFSLNEGQIADLLIFGSAFGVLGSVLSGWAGDRFGYKLSLTVVFGVWFLTFLGAMMGKPGQEKIIAALIGLGLGATYTLTRAWVVHLVPGKNIGEVFGLFNLAGYCSSIVGPVIFGLVLWNFRFLGIDKYRIGLISLLVFVLISFYYLFQLPESSGKKYAA